MDIKPPLASATPPPNTTTPAVTELPASLQQLPRGTLLTAVVESSRPVVPQASNPQAATTQITANRSYDVLLNISGNKIQTQSNAAFNPGQLLKVEITANSSLRVIQVATQQSAQLSQPLVQIQQGLRQTLPLQQNPALLLNNLAPLFKLLEATPATTQIRALLSTIPDLKQLSNPSILKNSVGQSGIFLESKIKSLQTQIQQLLRNTTSGPAQKTTPETTQRSAQNTLQAIQSKFSQQNSSITTSTRTALQATTVESNQTTPQQNQTNNSSNTRQALQTLIQNNAQFSQQLEKLIGQDFKAQLLKLSAALIPLLSTGSSNSVKPVETTLLQHILQILPDTRGNQLSGTKITAQTSLSLSNLPITTQLLQLLNPNLVPGQAQSPLQASAGQDTSSTDLAVSTVLRQIAATLAQVQTNQLQSLAGPRTDTDGGLLLNSWNIEIPVFLEGQFKPIQLQINEERHPESTSQQEKTRVWKITLGFDFEELGEFFATLRIINTSVSATFWSDKPETLQRISGELQHLNKSLSKLGLNVEELECRRGKPTLRETRLDQQLVDIKT